MHFCCRRQRVENEIRKSASSDDVGEVMVIDTLDEVIVKELDCVHVSVMMMMTGKVALCLGNNLL